MRAELARLLNRDVTGIERIGGGANSQVYKVEAERQRFALKVYFRHPEDKRDRLATEHGSFSYLWANGFREIPEPLAADAERGWAVYQFIEGEKISSGHAGEKEALEAADFLGRLRELSRKDESRKLGVASEACFSVAAMLENLDQRFNRLRTAAEAAASYQSLNDFLVSEFTPLLERVIQWSGARLQAADTLFAQELDRTQRTLSPSDFGFHNALRQPNGRIIFLDFEYFGWDDPAKMISDFLLHPAMSLSLELKKKFVSAVMRRFADSPGLGARLESVYPLFGLKWCLIMLNEFLPAELLRRRFAATAGVDRSVVQTRQLAKARTMLNRISGEYQSFPYRA